MKDDEAKSSVSAAEQLLMLLTEEFRAEFDPRLDEIDAEIPCHASLAQGMELLKKITPELDALMQQMGEELTPKAEGDDEDASAKRLFERMASAATRIVSIRSVATRMEKALYALCGLCVEVEEDLLTRNVERLAKAKEKAWN